MSGILFLPYILGQTERSISTRMLAKGRVILFVRVCVWLGWINREKICMKTGLLAVYLAACDVTSEGVIRLAAYPPHHATPQLCHTAPHPNHIELYLCHTTRRYIPATPHRISATLHHTNPNHNTC